MTHVACTGVLTAAAPALRASSLMVESQAAGSLAPATAAPSPVLSFYLDQPYLDPTGESVPYHPPPGTCSAQPLAALSEHELRCGLYGL